MREIDAVEAHLVWLKAEQVKRIADRLVGLGPFSVGLDGLLAAVPIAGTLFSLGAGLWLMALGLKARASWYTLARMGFYVGFRTLASIVPLEGWLVDFLFRGHMHAANALQKDLGRRFGAPAADAVRDVRRRPFAPLRALAPAGSLRLA